LRATNTGVSAIIDPAGRIVDQTPTFARANLVGDIAPLQGRTLYGYLGDWPAYSSLAVVLFWSHGAFIAWARRRREKPLEKPTVSEKKRDKKKRAANG
jgi:apolipoprotein N-acyltransferase